MPIAIAGSGDFSHNLAGMYYYLQIPWHMFMEGKIEIPIGHVLLHSLKLTNSSHLSGGRNPKGNPSEPNRSVFQVRTVSFKRGYFLEDHASSITIGAL